MKYLFLLILLSCATRENRQVNIAEKVFDLIKDYQKSFNEKQTLALVDNWKPLDQPVRMAVYFSNTARNRELEKSFNWKFEEKEKFIRALDRSPKISRVFELIKINGIQDDIRNLRMMAAQQGADTLLIVQGAYDIDTNLNPAALSYLLVLPVFFVKGNDVKGTFITQALLWDVRSPIVHLGAQGEGEETQKRPLAFRGPAKIIEDAREESLQKLSKKITDELNVI